MNIDREIVQKLIEENLGENFEINEIQDSSKYVFIFWKHKKYLVDDERGKITGVGPVVYNKSSKEYKLLGSGEIVYGDYLNYLNEGFEESEEKIPSFDEIKKEILRREYVNDHDLRNLEYSLMLELGAKCHFSWVENLKHENHIVINTDNQEMIKRFIHFWNELDYKYRQKSESELILWRVKTSA